MVQFWFIFARFLVQCDTKIGCAKELVNWSAGFLVTSMIITLPQTALKMILSLYWLCPHVFYTKSSCMLRCPPFLSSAIRIMIEYIYCKAESLQKGSHWIVVVIFVALNIHIHIFHLHSKYFGDVYLNVLSTLKDMTQKLYQLVETNKWAFTCTYI